MESHARRHVIGEFANSATKAQETNLFRAFSECVTSGKIDSYWPEIALKTQVVLDACLASARENGAPISTEPISL